MTTIRGDDLVETIAGAFQHISYDHPADYVRSLTAAYERKESLAAKEAMAAPHRVRISQELTNHSFWGSPGLFAAQSGKPK